MHDSEGRYLYDLWAISPDESGIDYVEAFKNKDKSAGYWVSCFGMTMWLNVDLFESKEAAAKELQRRLWGKIYRMQKTISKLDGDICE